MKVPKEIRKAYAAAMQQLTEMEALSVRTYFALLYAPDEELSE